MTTTQPKTTVGVVGAGEIGTSVAHACARAGVPVTLYDNSPDALRRAPTTIESLERLARLRRGRAELAEVVVTEDVATLARCAVVVENVVEDVAVKLAVHRELGEILPDDTLVAVNTSAIPISLLAEQARDPGRVLGAHFMNPVALIDTVELVRSAPTSPDTVTSMTEFLALIGKTGVVVDDRPGFVINRSLMLFVNEAIRTMADGVADPREIDRLFRGCLGHRSGPLQTADLIGLDTVLATLVVLEESYGAAFTPADELRRLVSVGRLGRKSGRGIYDYRTEGMS